MRVRRIAVPLLGLSLVVSATTHAGPLAADRFHWDHQANIAHWSKTYTFRVVGPALFTLRHGMQPYDGRTFSNKFVPVFTHNIEPGVLEPVSAEELFDGKPFASFGVSSPFRLARRVKLHQASSVWTVPDGRTFEGSITVQPPGEQTGWWTQHAADAWFDVTLGGSAPEPPARPAAAGVSGTYRLDANHYLGKLEVRGPERKLAVKMIYDGDSQWTVMKDVRFDPASGQIAFVRPFPGSDMVQYYRGKLSDGKLTGTFSFSDPPGAEYSWEATR